jgi:predicted NBD/HSP70 family sugar kinase
MTVGIRPDDLRRRNRAMVIAAIRRSGQASRTEIAATTALSHSTISAITSGLLGEGVLARTSGTEAMSPKRGRPQIGLGLNSGAATVLTLVLSLNSLSAALIDYAGEVVREEHRRLPTLTLSRNALAAEVIAAARRLIGGAGSSGGRVLRIALAVQGTTDSSGRSLLWSPITPHENIDFGRLLEDAFGIPVTVENDCNMMAEALRWRDPARYRKNFIAVLLSHGIGMGMVLKGSLFTGTHSSGGEFGHMMLVPEGALCRCGRRGCIEAYAGSYAIWRNARGIAETERPEADLDDGTMLRLAEAARAQDGPEREAFRRAGEAIGFGLGSLFALVDPAPVALVGLQASAFDLLEEPLREAIAKTAGGQHHGSISFDVIPQELPLIRRGGAMRALEYVDQEIFAPGLGSAPAPRDEVA